MQGRAQTSRQINSAGGADEPDALIDCAGRNETKGERIAGLPYGRRRRAHVRQWSANRWEKSGPGLPNIFLCAPFIK